MGFPLFSEVVLLQDVPEENLKAGDVGTVVEQHDIPGLETGYSLEIFNLLGETVAVVTLPQSLMRLPNQNDRPTVRSNTAA